MRHHTKTGYEISGYIDYEESLRRSRLQQDCAIDWYGIFHENKRLWPQSNDLSYYHWRTGASYTNDTKNFKVLFFFYATAKQSEPTYITHSICVSG